MSAISRTLRKAQRLLPFVGAPKPLVSVLELAGVIATANPVRSGIAYASIEPLIKDAFEPDHLAAVALVINSPGGSPVQSHLIQQAIRRAADKKNTPVLAFVEGVAASGGYLIALGADEIYADASSIIGSIGVISTGFGFTEAIARLGVERRVHTSVENKSQLDPFMPENPEDVARLETILNALHVEFAGLVRARRAGKLLEDENHFTGEFWTAREAERRGLIDGIAHLGEFMQRRFGENVIIRKVSARQSMLKRFLGSKASAAPQIEQESQPEAVLRLMEQKAHWARFGL